MPRCPGRICAEMHIYPGIFHDFVFRFKGCPYSIWTARFAEWMRVGWAACGRMEMAEVVRRFPKPYGLSHWDGLPESDWRLTLLP